MQDLLLTPDALTRETEAALVSEIEAAMEGISRKQIAGVAVRSRALRYGWGYDKEQVWVGDLPSWAQFAALALAPFNSITVNQYLRGDSIAPHVDSLDFGPTIQILSLLSVGTLDFKRKCCAKPFSMDLPPRSLLTMSGDYRYNWTHALRPVKDTRYSVVFRQRILK